MQAVGIVAEYNPFHNGHAYHIAQSKKTSCADGVIAVMSGNFTQRGEAAVFDKWIRAELALSSGADLVLELPAAFAVRSAGYFAQGAVQTLAATGICQYLSCGVESENTAVLSNLATYLASEPDAFRNALQKHLQMGESYPNARQNALKQLNIAGVEQLSQPNNILALHYLQTIQEKHLNMTPILVSRKGSYHADTLPDSPSAFASATAIRKLLLEGNSLWKQHMPLSATHILEKHLQKSLQPMSMDIFSQTIFTLLRRSKPEQLAEILEITEGLEHRMHDAAHQTDSLNDLCMAIKSKRYTYTRIQRSLCHLLLNITADMSWNEPQYIRVLGFNSTGQKLLKEMKKTAALPIIIRPARQRGLLNNSAQNMLALDIRATNIYMTGQIPAAQPVQNRDLLQMPIQV